MEGRANAALCRLLAARAGIAASRVSVRHGAGGRDKVLEFRELTDAELRRALEG